jgi:hypothetical protein
MQNISKINFTIDVKNEILYYLYKKNDLFLQVIFLLTLP